MSTHSVTPNTSQDTEYNSAPAFLDAWLRGVEIAGWRWFGNGKPPETEPRSKSDAVPRYDDIISALGWLSSGEATFLVAMYSFFNAYAAIEMWDTIAVRPLAHVAASLDEPRRRVIADLLIAYEGW